MAPSQTASNAQNKYDILSELITNLETCIKGAHKTTKEDPLWYYRRSATRKAGEVRAQKNYTHTRQSKWSLKEKRVLDELVQRSKEAGSTRRELGKVVFEIAQALNVELKERHSGEMSEWTWEELRIHCLELKVAAHRAST